MSPQPQRYTYRYGPDLFEKILHGDGSVELRENGRALSLAEWNRSINRFQSMEVKEKHPNPVVRMIEKRRRELTVRACSPRPREQWADLGCESGFIAEALAAEADRLVCIDVDEGLLARASERLAGRDNVTFVRSEVNSLEGVPSASMDGCLAAEILEHLIDVPSFLAEVARIVKPGGRVVITVPNDRLILTGKRVLVRAGARRMLGGLSDQLAIGHVSLWDAEKLNETLGRVFDVERVTLPFPFLNYFAVARNRAR